MWDPRKRLDFAFSATTGIAPDVSMVRLDIPILMSSGGSPGRAIESALRGTKGVQRVFFNPTTKKLSLWYRTEETGAAELYQAVKEAGFQTGTNSLRLRIRGIYCSGCVSQIEAALKGVGGVAAATLNPATSEALIEFWPQSTDLAALESAVDSIGLYRAEPVAAESPEGLGREQDDASREYRSLMRKWWFGAIIGTFTMILSYPQLFPHPQGRKEPGHEHRQDHCQPGRIGRLGPGRVVFLAQARQGDQSRPRLLGLPGDDDRGEGRLFTRPYRRGAREARAVELPA